MTTQETIHENEKLYGHHRYAGRCCKAVGNGPRQFSWHQCRRQARGPEGLFCPQHDPATVAAVRARSRQKWEARLKREAERDRAARHHTELVSVVEALLLWIPQTEERAGVRTRAKRLLKKIEADG